MPFEVLAAGKLSIVSNDCGAADILENEKIGFLIKPNASELADSILLALSKPELVKDMVTRGQRFVRENLTWKKYAQDMCSVFRKALGSG